MTIIHGTQGTIEVNGVPLVHTGTWEADVETDTEPHPWSNLPTYTVTYTVPVRVTLENADRFVAWAVRNRFRHLPYRIMRRKLARLR